MNTLTMKFGGLSVSTPPALTQVASIVLQEYERWDRLLIIVSALEGVTDALIEATHLAQISNRRGYRRIVATIRTRHLALIEKLPLDHSKRSELHVDIDQLLFEMLDICQSISAPTADALSQATIDTIISVGERIAARIVAALLRHHGLRSVAVDSPEILITDHTFGNANPNIELTQMRVQQHLLPMMERKIVPVITGFIGGTPDGKITTLGRGGSDYTASILGACVQASEIWMWTDVDGMMSTDPRDLPEAQVIPELAYNEVAELAYFGARILHARMIGPLKENNIPLRIKNIFKPQQNGTAITGQSTNYNQIKAVTAIRAISLTAPHSGPFDDITRLANQVFMSTIGQPADVTLISQSSSQSFVCLIIPTPAGPDAIHAIQTAMETEVHTQQKNWSVRPVSVVTAIGSELDGNPAVAARLFASLGDIRILALSQGPSHYSLSIVVESHHTQEALSRIHNLIVNTAPGNGQAPTG